jgi:hypothetical protein
MDSRLRPLLSGILLLTFEAALARLVRPQKSQWRNLERQISRRPRLRGDDGLKVNEIIPDSSAPLRERRWSMPGSASAEPNFCLRGEGIALTDEFAFMIWRAIDLDQSRDRRRRLGILV